MSYLQALPEELRQKVHFYLALNDWRGSGVLAVEGAVSGVDRMFLFPYIDLSGDTMLATCCYSGVSHSEVICLHSMTCKAAQGVRLRIPGRMLFIYSQPGVGPFLVAQAWDFSSVTVYASAGEIFAQRSVPVPAPGIRVHCEWLGTAYCAASHEWVRAGRVFYRMPALSISLSAPPALQQRGLAQWAIFGPEGSECLAVSVWTAEEDERAARGLEEGVCRLQVWELRSGRHLRTLAPSLAIDEGNWSFLPSQHAVVLHHDAAWYTALISLDDGRVVFRAESTDVQVDHSSPSYVWLLHRVGQSQSLACYDCHVGALLTRALPENDGLCSFFDNPALLGIRSATAQERYRFVDPHAQSSVSIAQPAAIVAACVHAHALLYVVQLAPLQVAVWMRSLEPARQPRLLLSRRMNLPLSQSQIRFLKPVGGSCYPPMLVLGAELWSFPLRSPF